MVNALIVDDDAGILESVRSLATEAGYAVATASDWDTGLSLFRLLLPDLVVADYNLPGSRHGLRLLFEACALRPSTRLVLMSAYLNADDLVQVEALGLVDRAVRKTDPVEAGRLILEELSAAAARGESEIDWQAVAHATLRGQLVDESAIDQLDGFLRANRLGDRGGDK
ncbi:MAG: response regulator [Dermatophilaceae bacterium]